MRRPSFRRPSLPRPSGLAGMARSVVYAVQDFLYFLGRIPRAIGRGFGGFWAALSVRARQRLTLAVLGAVAVIAVLALVVPVLPCQFPGGDACPPPDDAEEIVPADSLGYVHLSLDPDSDEYSEAAGIVAKLPGVSQQLISRVLAQVPGPQGEAVDFARDVAPWFGGQAALAIIPSGDEAEQVQLLEEGDAEAAGRFAESIAAGAPQPVDYRGVEIRTDDRGLATASVDGFLVIGTEQGVRRIVDVAEGAEGTRPLADDPVATEIREDLPGDRLADAFVSEDGIERLIAEETGPLASFEPFVDATASQGAAASLGAGDDGFEFAIRSSLDPERSESSPGFFTAFPVFEPSLPERLASDSLGYVGIAEPGTTVRELLSQATAEAPELARSFASAARRIRELGRVDLEDQVLPALGGEAAFALQPGVAAAAIPPEAEPTTTAPPATPEGIPGDAPAPSSGPPVPILQFVAAGVDGKRATEALAGLQGPIAEEFEPDEGLPAPGFERREVEGVDVQVLSLSPAVNLSYAVADDRMVVATQPEGVEQVVRGEGGLNDSAGFERATEDFPDEVSLLVYLDLAGLIRLAEREGLAEDPAYGAFAQELRRLQALGLSVEAESESISTDLRVTIDPESSDDPVEAEPPAD